MGQFMVLSRRRKELSELRPDMMEKILLGITGVWSEVPGGESAELFGAGSTAFEVELAQGSRNPDIHWERLGKAIGKQQHAVCNFLADARQFHQFVTGCGQG
jgi:hypothetical protein